MSKVIKGYDRASLFDLAILAGGCIECVFDIAVANSMSITDDVIIGQDYDVSELNQTDAEVLRLLNNDSVRPATAIGVRDMTACPYGGIGFMGIGIDFICS